MTEGDPGLVGGHWLCLLATMVAIVASAQAAWRAPAMVVGPLCTL